MSNLIIATVDDLPPPMDPVPLATRRPGTTRQSEYPGVVIQSLAIPTEFHQQWLEFWEYVEQLKRQLTERTV